MGINRIWRLCDVIANRVKVDTTHVASLLAMTTY
jgi:hypothetical protein